jgi:hypothetical protein
MSEGYEMEKTTKQRITPMAKKITHPKVYHPALGLQKYSIVSQAMGLPVGVTATQTVCKIKILLLL